MQKERRFVTTTTLAKTLGVHADTVRRMCARALELKSIPGLSRTPGGHWRIPTKAADTLAKAYGHETARQTTKS